MDYRGAKDLSTTYRGWKIIHTWTTHFTKESGETYHKYDFTYYKDGDEENSQWAIRSTLQDVKEDIDERILEREMIWI